MTVGAAYWRPRRLEAEAESTSTTPAGSGEGDSGAEGGETGEEGEEGGDGGEGAEGLGEPPEGTASDGPFGSEGEPPPPDDGGDPPPPDYDDPGRPDPPDYSDREGTPEQEPEPQQYQQRRRSPEEREIEHARLRAREALWWAVYYLGTGLTPRQRERFNCWFAGTGLSEAAVRAILQRVFDALRNAEIVADLGPGGAGATERDVPAETQVTGSRSGFIIVYHPFFDTPEWEASVIVHEGCHFDDPERFTGHTGAYNAFRFEGFVSELTGLPFDPDDRSVVDPPCPPGG